jgi:hypothetical protein
VAISTIIFYKYFINPKESSTITLGIFTLTNTVSFFCFVCLAINSYTNILHDQQSVEVYKKIYLSEKLFIIGIYSSLVISLVFLIPFGYFYSEEVMNDYYNGYSNQSKNKIFSSLKYTVRLKIYRTCIS